MRRAIFVWALAASCGVGLPYALWLSFYRAPLADELYFNQKIFYFHVPSAFMLFIAVFVCGIASTLYLKRREPRYDELAFAASELAVTFGAILLVTGSIWGKAAWDKWWVWDVRLTSSLVLWLLMVGYLLVRKYAGPGSERLAAGLAVFAMVDVPLVYLSVKLWRTIHPQTSVVPQLTGDMFNAFWVSVLSFLVFFALLLCVRVGLGRLQRKLEDVRERALDLGVLE